MGERYENRAAAEAIKERMARQVHAWGRQMGVPVTSEHVEKGVRMAEASLREADQKIAARPGSGREQVVATRGLAEVGPDDGRDIRGAPKPQVPRRSRAELAQRAHEALRLHQGKTQVSVPRTAPVGRKRGVGR